jgi:hypothetical protein
MSPSIWLVPLILFAIVFVIAQQRFYAAYRTKHGVLRPLRQRVLGGPDSDEFRGMLSATRQRDDDPVVERARRVYLVSFAILIAYGLLGTLTGSFFS